LSIFTPLSFRVPEKGDEGEKSKFCTLKSIDIELISFLSATSFEAFFNSSKPKLASPALFLPSHVKGLVTKQKVF
jgi:hypothetical protein